MLPKASLNNLVLATNSQPSKEGTITTLLRSKHIELLAQSRPSSKYQSGAMEYIMYKVYRNLKILSSTGFRQLTATLSQIKNAVR